MLHRASRHPPISSRSLKPRRTLLLRPPAAWLSWLTGSQSAEVNQTLQKEQLEPKLQLWLQSQGLPAQPLSLQLCGDEGRGLLATQNIRRGQRLLQVPGKLLLDVEAVLADTNLGPVLRQQPLPEWSVLAAALAFWRLQIQQGTCTSEWATYIETLPSDLNSVLQWAPGEAKRLLAGSPLLKKAISITTAAAVTKVELLPLLPLLIAAHSLPQKYPASVTAEADQATSPLSPSSASSASTSSPLSSSSQAAAAVASAAAWEEALDWSISILLSRLVRLSGDRNREALVPWADFANHDPRVSCCLDWDPVGQCVFVDAEQALQPGEQLHISYGAKSSGEFLLQYGFAPKPDTNTEQEMYTLELGLAKSDPLLEVKSQLLAQYGLPTATEFPLQIKGWAEGLLHYLAFTSVWPKGMLDGPSQLKPADVAEMLLMRREFPSMDGICMESLALQQLSSLCGKALKGYPTSMEYDKSLAAPQLPVPLSPEVSFNTVSSSSSSSISSSSSESTSTGQGKKQEKNSSKSSGSKSSNGSVSVSSQPPTPREILCASIRVRERQILQRTEFVSTSQLRELKRRYREADDKKRI